VLWDCDFETLMRYILSFKVLDCIRIVLAQWKSCTEEVPKGETIEVSNFMFIIFETEKTYHKTQNYITMLYFRPAPAIYFLMLQIKSCNGGLDVKEERKDLKFGLKMFLPVRDSGDKSVISSALDLSMQIILTLYCQPIVIAMLCPFKW
jgi:hypothetical protein